MEKYFTLLAQITYPGPGGPLRCTRTTTILDFTYDSQDDPDDEDCTWEETLHQIFFTQLKLEELQIFLDHSRREYMRGHENLFEATEKFKRLNNCDDLIELYRVKFNATDITITILEHTRDTQDKFSIPKTEVLLEEFHNNLKPLH